MSYQEVFLIIGHMMLLARRRHTIFDALRFDTWHAYDVNHVGLSAVALKVKAAGLSNPPS